jgi:cyclophilin family peptidyl-prolyl cis-trans isomerase
LILASRKRQRGGRRSSNRTKYLVIGLLAVILVVGSAWYVFVYSQQGKSPASGSGIIYATLSTSQGSIEVELYNNSAPKTVTNFVHLAQSGFYNSLVWHRIVSGFVIQTGDPNTLNGGGDPSTWGQGSSTQKVPLEVNDTSLRNNAGYLAMARGNDPNSGSSQFFINLTNNPSLDGRYTVFGKVIKGLDVALAIGNLPVNPQCQPSGGLQCQPTNTNQAMLIGVTISKTP